MGSAKPAELPLRDLRHERQLTLEQLAERSGVTINTIVYAELGERTPMMATRRKLLKALGLPLSHHREIFGPMRGEQS